MERLQEQKNLSQLINVESLLGKLGKNVPASAEKSPEKSVPPEKSTERLIPLDLKINSPLTGLEILTQIYEIFLEDVISSRDRLLHLNPSRRELIEHRLEFIARKIARTRGERLNRSLSLTEILRDTFREAPNSQTKLSSAAWNGFVTEVSLYKMLELFFLKSLAFNGWRIFEKQDLTRLNFAAHSFLTQRATGFAHDRHCWNFGRVNLYSWYSPTANALKKISDLLDSPLLGKTAWSDEDLMQWIFEYQQSSQAKFGHLDFNSEFRLGKLTLDILENQMGEQFVNHFHAQNVCKKFFIPALELGGVTLSCLDSLLGKLKTNSYSQTHPLYQETNQLHKSLWACESESFEVFWTEVLTLLRTLRFAQSQKQQNNTSPSLFNSEFNEFESANSYCLYRLPHVLHVVNANGPELHNVVQLPLGNSEVAKAHTGSAAFIQQYESFDFAILTDHIDRAKSLKWMKAISDQLPYWGAHVTSGTNVNWGELHLFLALTKLREKGVCLYYSHRPIPEGGDGERLRKEILGVSTLEYFVDFSSNPIGSYRYLYIFRKNTNKSEREKNKPFFGKLKSLPETLRLRDLEISNSSQLEILEKGWDQLFIKGTAPVLWHMNQKFSKLTQFAAVQTYSAGQKNQSPELFSNPNDLLLEADVTSSQGARIHFKSTTLHDLKGDHYTIYPFNPNDLAWMKALLNSEPIQFWIKQTILNSGNSHGHSTAKQFRILDIKNCPVLNLSHPHPELFEDAVHWLTFSKPDAAALKIWACRKEESIAEKSAKFTALSRLYFDLERIQSKYRPLFNNSELTEFKADAISYFYPSHLLCPLSQSLDVRIQYVDRHKTNLMAEHWTITGSNVMVSSSPNPALPPAQTLIVVATRQGPLIQIYAPFHVAEYLHAQIKALRSYTWSEVLSMCRMPKDLPLFSAQVTEIKRVVYETSMKLKSIETVLDELACALFELNDEFKGMLR